MKKFINDPNKVVDEMLEGFLAAHHDMVEKLPTSRVVVRRGAPFKDKVGLVTGGGSGHKPAFIGYVGDGLVDAVAVGDIFSSPSAGQIYDAIKAVDSGKGVLCMLGNYSGDVMNFDMAAEMAREDGIKVEQVIVNDDVGSSPKDKMENRRGVVGEVILWKIAGAKAKEGASLEELKKTAEKAIFNTRSMGVAHSPCTVPTAGEPTFSLGENEMEIGVGHHGEPGVKRMPMKSADETTLMLMEKILEDLPFTSGDEVVVNINGLGATPLLELYIIYRKVYQILKDTNIKVHRAYIGEYFTSLEMGGFSITLTKLDDELKKLIDAPARSPLFVQ
ncbi:MAG TPA: dihydroxyacetone kinase subunit DhaK [Candidatus Aerophobetes bacterium]|uniref:Dihydroxyacetone kinase subunit DhaK n=1 Tax=Aerophobetes bacterium TaxID=2030807 RepID=A0A7V0MZS9_UNCAE|nr:dihydroxyacetone kinase subunit DhaK [Candidatus Aerophobetes bacterium]